MNQDAPCLFIIILIVAIVANYFIYPIWFKPDVFLESLRARWQQRPGWYPMRDFFILSVKGEKDARDFLEIYKVASIFAEILILLFLGLSIALWIMAK